jgi:nitronate monooxygenase
MSLPALFDRLRLPVIGSPLFIVSNPELVLAQCRAGIVGSFPALNARPGPVLEDWLKRLTGELTEADAPFAVNQIVHRSNDRLMHDVELCVKYRVPIVITSLGAREEVNEAVHSYGGIVLHDIINDRFARKAIEKGADGLRISPFALIGEIRSWFDGPVALSGAITRGDSILAAQAMGADLAYIGSAFIATEEANAAPEYKAMLVQSAASDIVYTNLITGVHGNYLRGSLVAAGLDPDNLPVSDATAMNFGSGRTKAWKDIWGSGQGIGALGSVVPAAELVARLAREYTAARSRLGLAAA